MKAIFSACNRAIAFVRQSVIAILAVYDRAVAFVSGTIMENLMLLLTRLGLAGVFWTSGRTKVEEGTWLSNNDTARYLFQNDYSGVPLPPDFSMVMATYSEHLFPILLVLGLFTRLSALALLGMTMVIQIFVYPGALINTHMLWIGAALVLIVRGGGMISLDAGLLKARPA